MSDLSIYLILDGSGSMGGVKHDVVTGINDFIRDQRDEKAATGDDIKLSLTVFDDQVRNLIFAEEIDLVKDVTVNDTFLGGSTALYDAIGKTISKAEVDDNTPKKLVIIYTDGHENASKEYDSVKIKKMITDLQDTNSWTFVYMSAELADFAQPQNMGIPGGNTVTGTARATTNAHWTTLSTSASNFRGMNVSPSGTYYASTVSADSLTGLGGSMPTTTTTIIPTPNPVSSDPGDEQKENE